MSATSSNKKNNKRNQKTDSSSARELSSDELLCYGIAYELLENEVVPSSSILYYGIGLQPHQIFGENVEGILRHEGLINQANTINYIAHKYNVNPAMQKKGLRCAAYFLNPLIPLRISNSHEITDLNELPSYWRKYGYITGPAIDDFLGEESFRYWILKHNPEKSEYLGLLQAAKTPSAQIAYSLFNSLSYDFLSEEDDPKKQIRTPEQLGKYLNDIVANRIKIGSAPLNHSVFDLEKGGRVISYLKAHKNYFRIGNEIDMALHGRASWAKGSISLYNPYVDAYKAIRLLGVDPYYEFPDGKRVTTPAQLRTLPPATVEGALKTGHLADWLSVFFQEKPNEAFHSQEAYAEATIRFLDFITSLHVAYIPAVKYNHALREIDFISEEFHKKVKFSFKGLLLKLIFAPLALLSLLLVILFGIQFLVPDSKIISPLICLIYGAIFLGAVIYFVSRLWRVYERVPGYTYLFDVSKPNFEMKELDALRYAFGPKNIHDSVDSRLRACMNSYKHNQGKAQNSQIGYSLGCIVTSFLLLIGMFIISPSFGGEKSLFYESVNPAPKLLGTYQGKVDGKTTATLTLDSIVGLRVDSARFSIKRNPIVLSGNITREKSDIFLLELTPANPSDSLSSWFGLYRLEVNTKENKCSGVFLPYKANKSGEIVPKDIELTIDRKDEAAATDNSSTKKDKSNKSVEKTKNNSNSKADNKQNTYKQASEADQNQEIAPVEGRSPKFEIVNPEDMPGQSNGPKYEEVDPASLPNALKH